MIMIKNLALMAILALALVACGSSGGDSNGGGNPALGDHSASGTYTFDDSVLPMELSLNFTSSDFQGCGPGENDAFIVEPIDGTTIKLIADDGFEMIWVKTSGPDSELVGTWEMTDEDGTYIITFGADESLTLTANITQCDE